MKELKIYTKYFFNILESVQKPAIWMPGIGLSLTTSNYQLMIFLLLGLFAVDYITGVMASWVEWKKENTPERFRNKGFTSEKSRMSIVKMVTYFLFILLTWCIEIVFKIKSFEFSFMDHKGTITLVAMAISCAIEFYSIFWENLPRAGFSISAKLKKVVSVVKSAKNEIKDITDGNHSPS
ncbi:phage holin family protein [Amniculibacterium sp. G2-70]|uniref:phage holin family protein n=1 Tax=Amniculibacterium sp. G2-70 TaxID=2767188 RepID=UPI0016544146|nr:phage holin family protein [Amniculibacterium sp. G2-70]